MTGDPFMTILFFSKYRTDIWEKILSVMEVVFDHSQSSGDPVLPEAEIPSEFCLSAQVSVHAFQIRFLRDAPLAVKPIRRGPLQLRHVPQRDILKHTLPLQISDLLISLICSFSVPLPLQDREHLSSFIVIPAPEEIAKKRLHTSVRTSL